MNLLPEFPAGPEDIDVTLEYNNPDENVEEVREYLEEKGYNVEVRDFATQSDLKVLCREDDGVYQIFASLETALDKLEDASEEGWRKYQEEQ